MSKFFLAAYHFFQKRRSLFVVLLASFLFLAAFISFNLKFEEDIAQLMPVEEGFEDYNTLFNNSELADRIVFHLRIKDSTALSNSVEKLINYSDSLVANLKSEVDSALYKDITQKIDESQFLSLYDIILDNLPLFLQNSDYSEINSLTQETEIKNRIEGSYKALLSPAGFAVKKAILKDPLGLAQIALKHLTGFQVDDNFEIQNGYIVTKDKKHLLFFLSSANSARETFLNTKLIQQIDDAIEKTKHAIGDSIKAEYFGAPAVAVANANRIKIDVTITVTIALFALFLLISFFYRRKRSFFLILIPTIFGAVFSIAFLTLIKGTVSLISIGIGSVLLGITIDYSLHIFTHYRSTGNAAQVIKDVSNPIIVSSLTTSGAFLCLLFVRSEALHDLGLFAAFSVFGAAIFALLILPHLLPFAVGKKTIESTPTAKNTFLDKWGKLELNRIKWLSISILIISLAFLIQGQKAAFEKDLNSLNYLSENLKESEKNLNAISSATMRGIYLMSKGDKLEDALKKTESISSVLDSLKNESLIRAYTPISSALLSEDLQVKRIENWKNFWSEDKKELVKASIKNTAESLRFKSNAFNGFFENLDKSYNVVPIETFDPFKNLLLRDFISEKEESSSLLTLLRVDLENKEEVYNRLAAYPSVSVLDRELLASQFVEILRKDFDLFVTISLLFVFLILHLAYGRPELAIITFIPIVLSWLWTLGLMNLLGLNFNIVNIIIATFIFGLGIDFSIFIMRGLLQKWKYGEDNLPSYKTSILLSVITTLTGIGVLIFAQHPALKSIAALSIIGISSVLLIALIVEPLLFEWLIKKPGINKLTGEKENREYPITILSIFQTLANYIQLTLGCILLTVFALILLLFFFIPLKTRKLWFHYGIWLFAKFYVRVNFPFNETFENPHNETFEKPAILISNHQSLMDTPMMWRFHPKTIILTKDWVRKFPLFRIGTWMADFYSISDGFGKILPLLKERVKEGYSIAIFPEGSRSPDDSVKRFHKGAFYLAELLSVDIVPLYLHGTGRFLRKGSLWGKWNPLTIRVGKRIEFLDETWGEDYSKRTKSISKNFKKQFAQLRSERETVHYWREKLLENYLYKGPVLEWYMKVKTKMENNYELFDKLIPETATITNLGCGYGFLDYMLSFRSEKRDILGIDYDEEKIKVAQNCNCKKDHVNFIAADIAHSELRKSDVFILADVLHYLQPEEQFKVLEKCHQQLSDQGILIIRDGDADLKKRHKGTLWTEIFSTKIFQFNKTKNPLNFISGTALRAWSKDKGFEITEIDNTRKTSNIIFVLKKQ